MYESNYKAREFPCLPYGRDIKMSGTEFFPFIIIALMIVSLNLSQRKVQLILMRYK